MDPLNPLRCRDRADQRESDRLKSSQCCPIAAVAIPTDPCQPLHSDDDGDGDGDRGNGSSWWIVPVPMRLDPLREPLLFDSHAMKDGCDEWNSAKALIRTEKSKYRMMVRSGQVRTGQSDFEDCQHGSKTGHSCFLVGRRIDGDTDTSSHPIKII